MHDSSADSKYESPSDTPNLPAAERSRYPIAALLERIQAPSAHVQITGAAGTLRPSILADLSQRTQRPLVILTPEPADARQLHQDLLVFSSGHHDADLSDQPALYPEFDVGPYHNASPDRSLTMQRMATLHALGHAKPPRYTIACIDAASRRTLSPSTMRAWSRTLSVGDEIPNEPLRAWLADAGYTEVPVVEDPGTFALRGDIVDVFPPGSPHATRIERWGDEISDIRTFHPDTQRTVDEHTHCALFPVRQELLDDASLRAARPRLRDLADRLKVPSRAVREVLADLDAGIHFIGIDALLPALHGSLSTLLDYAPEHAIFVLFDPDNLLDVANTMWARRLDEFDRASTREQLIFPPDAYFTPPADLVHRLTHVDARLELRQVVIEPSGDSLFLPSPLDDDSFEFRARANTDIVHIRKRERRVEETIAALTPKLNAFRQRYGRICITCRSRGQVDRLISLLSARGFDALDLPPPIDLTEPVPPPADLIEVYHADLSEGFRSEHLSLCLIAGEELFGQRVATTSSQSITEHAAISHFRDLSAGDHVVHVDFGIGLYHGLVHLEVGGIGNDFLHLEYADGDKLYIPVYRLARVQKFVGQSDRARLDSLGGSRWERTKEKVKEQIRAIAGDLLALYARREMAKGFSYSPPDDLYRQFEDAFPFEETPDQARAIRDTLSDMISPRPMDRLVCGDVGFGKTEVAIRAAMKAVTDGKQVAVLVPTTILCEQHRLSFRARLSEFGVRVEALSRFRSPAESRKIVADTASGEVDVLIGTHRLLGSDIDFHDLGLLIVDEEQRFGVTHKDKIKKIRTNIDVLTLTATPIPRTMQMSLLGIRDLSIIATPPHNRLAVRTHVAKFSDNIIREALMRELSRGGQVFFVHNRVKTIDEMAAHLSQVVPEARIAVGHGQMPENKLEEVMLDYIEGDINVLVCSSIIESGLDIPNANTIVVNRADLFGISQLYQLRGRVGRSKERAYAYLLIPPNRVLPRDAQARLDVIQTHTELGSGFQVATYDLEIRGAGSLLGDDQSGHVQAVGLDLYTELLEETVNEMRDLDVAEDFEPEVNLPVEAFLPASYIDATSLRLMFYKRLSLSRSFDELYAIYDELADRFGNPPLPVRNLRDVIAVKIACRLMRARRLDTGPSAISVELDPSTTLAPEKIIDMVRETRGRLRITDQMKLIFQLKPDESAQPLKTTRTFVDNLLTYRRSA